jgi:diadenylate cyclase
MIIRDNRIHAAGCFLPLSNNPEIIKDLGTRHRAGIGMSENSDAVIIIVSEETGNISTALDGVLVSNYSYQSLKRFLEKTLVREENVNTGKKPIISKFLKTKDKKDIPENESGNKN